MPLKKLTLKVKKDGARGTEAANEVCDMLSENWDQFREQYLALDPQDQDDMLEHFEGVIENLGDILFGEDSNEEDLRRFVMARPDEEQDAFAKAMAENLLIQDSQE